MWFFRRSNIELWEESKFCLKRIIKLILKLANIYHVDILKRNMNELKFPISIRHGYMKKKHKQKLKRKTINNYCIFHQHHIVIIYFRLYSDCIDGVHQEPCKKNFYAINHYTIFQRCPPNINVLVKCTSTLTVF